MEEQTETWLPIREAAARHKLDYYQLHKWYRSGHIRGRKAAGRAEIEASSLADFLPPAGWDWLAESCRQYGISYTILYNLVQKGQVNACKRGGRWQVERISLERALAERQMPEGWLTTAEAGARLGVSAQEVLRRIRANQLHAREHGQQLLVAEKEIQELVTPDGWLTTRELAEKAGVAQNTVSSWIAKGWIQGRKVRAHWIVEDTIPEQRQKKVRRESGDDEEQEPHREPLNPENSSDWNPVDESTYLPLRDAANHYGLTYQQLHKLIHYKRVKRIYEGRYVLVDIASLEDWLPPPGWAWLHDAAKEYGVSYARVRRFIKRGQVRFRKRGQRWQVERYGLEVAFKRHEVPAGWITIQEAANRLHVTGSTALKRIEAGLLSGRKHGWYWIVEETAVMAQVVPQGWISVEEATQITQVTPATMIRWIQKDKVRGQKLGGRWFVEQKSIVAMTPPPNWISLTEASERWRIPRFRLCRWAQQGRILAQKIARTWYVPDGTLPAFEVDSR